MLSDEEIIYLANRDDREAKITRERDEARAERDALLALLIEAGDDIVCGGMTGVRSNNEEWKESHWCPRCDCSVDRNLETRTKIRAALADAMLKTREAA